MSHSDVQDELDNIGNHGGFDGAFPSAGHRGLTKRDWLAGMALNGLLASGHYSKKDGAVDVESAIDEAYHAADSMIQRYFAMT